MLFGEPNVYLLGRLSSEENNCDVINKITRPFTKA